MKKLSKSKNNWKVRDHCHYTGINIGKTHSICNLKFNVPNGISVVFHDGSNYDYHFIIIESANEFEQKFECLGESTEKYKKEALNIDKDGNESVVTTIQKIKFLDGARFMASSISNLNEKLAIEIHKIKFNNCDCFLKYKSVMDSLIKYKSLSCNKLDRKLKK